MLALPPSIGIGKEYTSLVVGFACAFVGQFLAEKGLDCLRHALMCRHCVLSAHESVGMLAAHTWFLSQAKPSNGQVKASGVMNGILAFDERIETITGDPHVTGATCLQC